MTQEEKAKRYDEALHKAKNYYSTTDSSSDIKLIGLIFPELKESEDERIMGNIIATIHLYYGEPLEDEAKEMIAWLEKQGNNMGISEATKQKLEDNLNKALEKETPESLNKFLEKQGEQKPAKNKGMNLAEEEMTPFQKKVYCIVDTAIEEEQGLSNICNELLALAKQEIEQKSADTEKGAKGNEREIPISEPPLTIKHAREVMGIKQDTAWSEVDDVKINRIVACLENLNVAYNDILLKDVAWLKSLKERYAWKPSDEQIIELRRVISGCSYDIEPLAEMEEQLKKLREE